MRPGALYYAGPMATKNPRYPLTFRGKNEYGRITEFFLDEYGSANAGIREGINLLLKKHGLPPLEPIEWGNRSEDEDTSVWEEQKRRLAERKKRERK
jgi:hypothetical protein